MAENHKTVSSASPHQKVTELARAFDAVGALIARVRSDQWSVSTPCTDWSVAQLVEHLIGLNRAFTALLISAPTPRRLGSDGLDDLVSAYRVSSNALIDAFAQPGVLEREFVGPLGSATGADRLQIRLYDLLAHGWDLAQATGQPEDLPEDLAEQALQFVRTQVTEQSRVGRFGPAREVSDDASAVRRLVAFLGRPVPNSP
jgi:uncharacterized protein (TIGR03086 family)